jgi:hypothetical protein
MGVGYVDVCMGHGRRKPRGSVWDTMQCNSNTVVFECAIIVRFSTVGVLPPRAGAGGRASRGLMAPCV